MYAAGREVETLKKKNGQFFLFFPPLRYNDRREGNESEVNNVQTTYLDARHDVHQKIRFFLLRVLL